MPPHWQSKAKAVSGVEDMVLISKISEDAISENLRKRFLDDCIYTYIGPVLIAVNPYKNIQLYGEKDIEQYQGSAIYENPPHIYALADDAYRNMLIEVEGQCVIISGESGAGKTVSAKHIMNYIAKVSGGGADIQRVKNVILESNPLLEAFGNAKTVRNNNSSRFGKYVEIQFTRAGQPDGGRISNFLLEKSRVIRQNPNERNFHIFYQLCSGVTPQQKEQLGVADPTYYYYLNQSGCFAVDGTDDKKEFADTMHAMSVMSISDVDQWEVLKIVASVLHLGNLEFIENGNYAQVRDPAFLSFPAYLLGLDEGLLNQKLTTRVMESRWGGKTETTTVTLTVEQAIYTRDALSKALYARLFDFLVAAINTAMAKPHSDLSMGVLDIYGFEIFDRNGFEQFCINFVNEKLQQIFIELTLKAEQEEYQAEGIKWTPIEFFNNKVVCDLIEERRAPPGILCVLDDICATLHSQGDGADQKFLEKLVTTVQNPHLQPAAGGFKIVHYAGEVIYDGEGFCERNRDVLFSDIILLMQSSSAPFIAALFPDDPNPVDKHGRQKKAATAGGKIRDQANDLVVALMKCTPHYIRCLKPNETKRSHDWDKDRCTHQVRYLGLKENIRVRRAGFAFRREFDKFMRRYAILTPETYPQWKGGDVRKGIAHLMASVSMEPDQWQLGKSKVFIKNPESLFLLEEVRERKFDGYARKIQIAYRRWKAQQYYEVLKQKASDILMHKKERRAGTINRNFIGDYIGLQDNPTLRAFVGKKERIEFAYSVKKYDRRFRPQLRDLMLTANAVYLVGREKVAKGPNKGEIVEVLKRRLEMAEIGSISLSTKQDDFVVLHSPKDFDSVFEMVFKTEFLTVLSQKYQASVGRALKIDFSDAINFTLKKEGWGGGGVRTLQFESGPAFQLKESGKKLVVTVPPGLPKDSTPGAHNFKSGGAARGATAPRGAPSARGASAAGRGAPAAGRGAGPGRPAPAPSAAVAPPMAAAASAASRGAPSPRGGAASAASRAGAAAGGPSRAAPGRPAPPPAARPPPPARPKPKLPQAKALYDYEAQDADELLLRAGDMVSIVKKDPSGWWQGRVGEREGLFPANYVEEVAE